MSVLQRCPIKRASTVLFFYPLPDYQLKRFQRLQNACASFVLKKYAKEADLLTLNWLNAVQRRKMAMLKLTSEALYDTY